MNMLVPVSQTSAVLSRRNFLGLGAAGAVTSLLPTVRFSAALAEEQGAAGRGKESLSNRIFLQATLQVKPKGADRREQALGDVRGIITIDPKTGKWETICGFMEPDRKVRIVHPGFDPRVSRDGKMLAFAQFHVVQPTEIWTCDLTSRHTAMVVAEGGTSLCWSPDGKRFACTKPHFTDDGKSQNVTWEISVAGSGKKKLPILETDEIEDWSGDGKWFVAVTNRKKPFGTGYQLYRMRPDGSEELRLTKDGLNCYPRFSLDSQHIVYLHLPAKAGPSLHVMDVDGRNDREVLREEGLTTVDSGCFSPDGRHLAAVRFDWHLQNGQPILGDPADSNFRLQIMDVDGKNRRELPLPGAKVLWLGHPDWR
jgi:Tol biopolymer transport system component